MIILIFSNKTEKNHYSQNYSKKQILFEFFNKWSVLHNFYPKYLMESSFLSRQRKKGAANIYRLDLERAQKKAVICLDTYVSMY